MVVAKVVDTRPSDFKKPVRVSVKSSPAPFDADFRFDYSVAWRRDLAARSSRYTRGVAVYSHEAGRDKQK